MTFPPKYFASLPLPELGEEVIKRIEEYPGHSNISRLSSLWQHSYQFLYGLDGSNQHVSSTVFRSGESDELAEIRVNHFRALINTLVSLITSSRVTLKAKAVSVDYASLTETELTDALLEYYYFDRGVEAKSKDQLESALAFGEAFIYNRWDTHAGKVTHTDEEGNFQYSGDIKQHLLMPWDVYRDQSKKDFGECQWAILRLPMNRYDLSVQYPQDADVLLAAPGEDTLAINPGGTTGATDDVVVYIFLHKRTPTLPLGRQAAFLSDGTPITGMAGPLPTQECEWPITRLAAGDMRETPNGYTTFFDAGGMQEVIDSLISAIVTNQTTLATQMVVAPAGTEFTPDDVGGMRIIYVPPDSTPPQPLQLTKTAPEVFTFIADTEKRMELVVGTNNVVRGQPQSGEQSGAALALLASQSIQQSARVQSEWVRSLSESGEIMLELLRNNLKAEMQLAIVGRGNEQLVNERKYSGDSFARIKKVRVEISNPLLQTPQGRAQIADNLIQRGLIKDASQYLMLIETGQLKPLTQGLSSELLLVRAENEQLMSGEAPIAIASDDHALHVREHKAVLASPEARKNPTVVEAVLAHNQEHEQLLYSLSPQQLYLFGQPPPPPAPTPGAAPPTPGQGTPEESPMGPPPEGALASGAAQPAQMPSQPTNPLTGGEYNPVTGGL